MIHARDREAHIYDYLRIIYKWRKPAIILFAIIVITVTAFTLVQTPVYRATARIHIERATPKALDVKDLIPVDASSTEFYQTQYKILQSRSLATRVIKTLNLEQNRIFNPRFDEKEKAKNPERYEEVMIKRFMESYKVDPIRNSRLVDVSFGSRNPALAAEVANGIAKSFIFYTMDWRTEASSEAKDFLTKQIEKQKKVLEDSEQALQNYKEKYGIVQLQVGQKESENVALQRLSGLTANLTAAQNARIEAETRYKQVQDMLAKGANYESIPGVTTSPLVQTLRANEAKLVAQVSEMSQKFGEKHPRMVQVRQELEATRKNIQLESQNVIRSIKNDYAIAQAKEANARRALEGQKSETQRLSEHGIQYAVLQREVEKNSELYENLLKHLKETSVEKEYGATNVRIIDAAAAPLAPAKPKKAQNILLAIVVGLFAGAAAAFVLEYLDNTVKTPDDVKEFLDAPNLAVIPTVDFKAEVGDDAESPGIIVHHKPQSTIAEAFRSLRTAVLFSSADGGPRYFIVTSFSPQEGKTFVAVNAAHIMALAGERVLVIDGDLRRPAVHKVLNQDNDRGLTNLIVGGNGSLGPAGYRENIDVITSGPIPPNPSELLGSKKMLSLIESLDGKYDRIIIDSPPVGSTTDALVMAKLLDCPVLVVIHGGTTTKEEVIHARELLENVGVKVLGAVLNNTPVNKSGYHYHYHHRYHYHGEGTDKGSDKKSFLRRLKI